MLTQNSAHIIQSVTLQQEIQETFSAGDWPLFSQGAIHGNRPIAVLPDDIRQWLNVSADVLLLSQHTALKQYREHSDIKPDDYRRIQLMLNEGEIRSDRTLHLGLIQEQGKWFYAVIKATRTGLAVFLQSFRRTNPNDLITIRERSALKRAAQ